MLEWLITHTIWASHNFSWTDTFPQWTNWISEVNEPISELGQKLRRLSHILNCMCLSGWLNLIPDLHCPNNRSGYVLSLPSGKFRTRELQSPRLRHIQEDAPTMAWYIADIAHHLDHQSLASSPKSYGWSNMSKPLLGNKASFADRATYWEFAYPSGLRNTPSPPFFVPQRENDGSLIIPIVIKSPRISTFSIQVCTDSIIVRRESPSPLILLRFKCRRFAFSDCA